MSFASKNNFEELYMVEETRKIQKLFFLKKKFFSKHHVNYHRGATLDSPNFAMLSRTKLGSIFKGIISFDCLNAIEKTKKLNTKKTNYMLRARQSLLGPKKALIKEQLFFINEMNYFQKRKDFLMFSIQSKIVVAASPRVVFAATPYYKTHIRREERNCHQCNSISSFL